MPIVISNHAKRQLKRRKISQKLVLSSVRNPQEIIDSYRDRKLRRKQVGSKMLEVITRSEGSKITVITAYYLKE